MNFSQTPNLLTILRIILTVPIVITLLNQQYFITIILLAIAGITDALDGFIAKKFDFSSRLGSILDPAADKILLTSSLFAMFFIEIIPLWLFILIFIRDIMIVAGTVGYLLGSNDKSSLTPSNISKINTVLQIFMVIFVVLAQIYSALKIWQLEVFIITATTTFISGVDYIWMWINKVILQEKKCN